MTPFSTRLATIAFVTTFATGAPALVAAQGAYESGEGETQGDASDGSGEDGDPGESVGETVSGFFADQGEYPVNYAARALTLKRFQLRADLGFFVDHADLSVPGAAFTYEETLFSLGLGAAFGITDNFELGLSSERLGARRTSSGFYDTILPATLVPVVLDQGNAGNLGLYFRARFFGGGLIEVAADLGLIFPTAGSKTFLGAVDFGFFLAGIARVHLHDRVALDLGVQFDLTLIESPPMVDADHLTNLDVPIFLTFGLMDPLWITIETGVRFPDFDLLTIPLGFELGYGLAVQNFLLDLVVGFDFPALVNTSGDQAYANLLAPDAIGTEHWMLTLAVRAHAQLGTD